jgi:type VI secretion system secreted protein Hcp
VAQPDYFLVLDGIKGESRDKVMSTKGAIDVDSWSWGESQTGAGHAGGGSGAGKAAGEDLHFQLRMGRSTPALIVACATGQHIKKAELYCRKAGKGQVEYLKFTLSDVIISSYQIRGTPTEVEASETLKLNFSKLELAYRPQQFDGSLGNPIPAGYDFKEIQNV